MRPENVAADSEALWFEFSNVDIRPRLSIDDIRRLEELFPPGPDKEPPCPEDDTL